MTANPVWHRMLYICTHMTTVGVRGLMITSRVTPWPTPGVFFMTRDCNSRPFSSHTDVFTITSTRWISVAASGSLKG